MPASKGYYGGKAKSGGGGGSKAVTGGANTKTGFKKKPIKPGVKYT